MEGGMKHGPLRLSVAITRAKLNLICLLQKPVADLASAPKLCFQNMSSRVGKGGSREGWRVARKNDEPLFTRTFLDRCIFNSLQAAEEGCWMDGRAAAVGGIQRRPVILGPSEDAAAPRGSIADDKVTRLRVNLCYLHLITVSCVLVPADRSPLRAHSTRPAEKKASGRITLLPPQTAKASLTPAPLA